MFIFHELMKRVLIWAKQVTVGCSTLGGGKFVQLAILQSQLEQNSLKGFLLSVSVEKAFSPFSQGRGGKLQAVFHKVGRGWEVISLQLCIGYTPRVQHEVNESLRQPSLWCVTYLYYDSASLVFYLPKVTQVTDSNGGGLFSKETPRLLQFPIAAPPAINNEKKLELAVHQFSY